MANATFKEINTTDALDDLLARSAQEPVVIFKHSLTCPISRSVHDDVTRYDGEIALVIMQHARPLSNEIAARTGVRHESPQALVLRDGRAVWHAAHYDITAEDLHQAVQTAA